jgi:hypothetical protein
VMLPPVDKFRRVIEIRSKWIIFNCCDEWVNKEVINEDLVHE